MAIKPWLQVPSPRHLLNDGDDEPLTVSHETWTTLPSVPTSTLYCIAPRLARFVDLKSLKTVGKIESGTTLLATTTTDGTGPQELYDLPSDESIRRPESPKCLYHADIKRVNSSDSLIILPVLDADFCHTFSSKVLSILKPKQVIVVSPGNMVTTSRNIYSLKNSEYTGIDPAEPVEPPFYFSGAPASLLTQCSLNALPAIGLLIRAEGQQGYEAIDYELVGSDVINALKSLGLNGLKLHDHFSTLYL